MRKHFVFPFYSFSVSEMLMMRNSQCKVCVYLCWCTSAQKAYKQSLLTALNVTLVPGFQKAKQLHEFTLIRSQKGMQTLAIHKGPLSRVTAFGQDIAQHAANTVHLHRTSLFFADTDEKYGRLCNSDLSCFLLLHSSVCT